MATMVYFSYGVCHMHPKYVITGNDVSPWAEALMSPTQCNIAIWYTTVQLFQ